MITIDGSQGEGGGQILRTSLSLSMITGIPFQIHHIRAGRKKPGLARQHLLSVESSAQICKGKVEGAFLGSQNLTFVPGAIQGGTYHFALEGAGSTTLICQTLVPALLRAKEKSHLTLEGGTHNPMAPPYPFLEKIYFPLLRSMGAKIQSQLHKPGFYPAGGGKVTLEIEPSILSPLEILERGKLVEKWGIAALSNLPFHILQREQEILEKILNWPSECFEIQHWEAVGQGNVVMVGILYENAGDLCSSFGERKRLAEEVAKEAATEAKKYFESEVPVGEHLADQLLLPLSMAGKGRFRTCKPTEHSQTQKEIIEKFLPIKIEFIPEGKGIFLMDVNVR